MKMKSLMACMLIGFSITYGHAQNERFITIIGPDGFPMVVPHTEKSKQDDSIKKPVPQKNPVVTQPVYQPNKAIPEISFATKPVPQPTQPVMQSEDTPVTVVPKQVVNIQPSFSNQTTPIAPKVEATSNKIVPTITNKTVVSVPQDRVANPIPVVEHKTVTSQDQERVSSVVSVVQENDPKSAIQQITNNAKATDSAYVLVDGEKYYDVEYLEEKEFNLEGKSRFYQIPMAGSGGSNWNIIERTKGVDMSWFNWRNKAEQSARQEVVALGEHYQVLSAESLETVLPNRCIAEKTLKKSKELKNRSASFWPRAPLNDDFDFELLSLKQQKVQNLKLTSFAKSEKNQTYYWPLVVFLDQKGCVTEGVSGYFTKAHDATMLQNNAIEGVLQLPETAQYILFTPLESGVDVPQKKLTNEGQITLTVLR